MIQTYINHVDAKQWTLSFGGPMLGVYEGPTIEIDDELAEELLAMAKVNK